MLKTLLNFVETDPFQELNENTLFSTQAEKDLLVQDKSRVAHAFLFNFFGMLGMINATTPSQQKTILNFLKQDKKLQIRSINDDNHDISLSLKLAKEAGFFSNEAIVNDITRFLVKLKAGQITNIDSTIVGNWTAALKPAFAAEIKDALMRQTFLDFQRDKGQTIDISRFAVAFKKRVNKISDGGDYQRLAKRFFGLKEIIKPAPGAAPVAPVTTMPAGVSVASPTIVTPPVASPAKKSYYKSVAQRKAEAAAKAAAALPAAATNPVDPLGVDDPNSNFNTPAPTIPPKTVFLVTEIQVARLLEFVVKYVYLGLTFDTGWKREVNAILGVNDSKTVVEEAVSIADCIAKLSSTLKQIYGLPGSGTTNQLRLVTIDFKAALEEFKQLTKFEGDPLEFIIKEANGRVGYYPLGLVLVLAVISNGNIEHGLFTKIAKGFHNNNAYSEILRDLDLFKGEDSVAKMRQNLVTLFANTQELLYPRNYRNPLTLIESPTHFDAYRASDVHAVEFAIDVIKESSYLKTAPLISAEGIVVMYGINAVADKLNISRDRIDYMKSYVLQYIAPSLSETDITNIANTISYSSQLVNISQVLANGIKYDKDQIDHGGIFLTMFYNFYADDLLNSGPELSLLYKRTGNKTHFNFMVSMLGFDIDDIIAKFPNDAIGLKCAVLARGCENYTVDQIVSIVKKMASRMSYSYSSSKEIESVRRLLREMKGDRDTNTDKMAQTLLAIHNETDSSWKQFSGPGFGNELLNMIPYCSKQTVVEWMDASKQTGNEFIMGHKLYMSLANNRKSLYVDALTGIAQDTIGTAAEGEVENIISSLPQHVKQRMRNTLVGASVLIEELEKGDIKPFDIIDNKRLKKIFLYNDIDLGSIVKGLAGKKKKSETYAAFFSRVKKELSTKEVLSSLKISESTVKPKDINRVMVERDIAGHHGDVRPLVNKVYEANVEFPEFWDFRAEKAMDGSIVPAYHGTGGIAAAMILRYGFAVIHSSDPSVTGRMLGDGVYFTNKIDKSLQYVSNGGFSRRIGSQGYIFQLDTNLGDKGRDYRVAGVGGDAVIRSPEWCVSDPKKQTRIIKVYEVTLVSKDKLDTILAEDSRPASFKNYLKEQNMGNTKKTGFIFRDGMIPIITGDLAEPIIKYVDFEEALQKKLITPDMFEPTGQGPMILFHNTNDQYIADERYADHMNGNDLQDYIRLFLNKMSK